MVPWQPARVKVQIRLSIQRLRTSQEKAVALAKLSRRDIADLLAKGRTETARLRVEGLIQGEIQGELLEVLELYAETLQARFQLLDSSSTEPDPAISDAVCSIVYAAPRTDIKELNVLREMLMHKFGRTWSLTLIPPTNPSDPLPTTVPTRVLSKLRLFTPTPELVDAYLYEIAKGYKVDWKPAGPATEEGEVEPLEPLQREDAPGDSQDKKDEGGAGIAADGLNKGAGARKTQGQEKGDASTKGDIVKGDSGAATGAAATAPPSAPTGGAKKMSEEELLAQRFERLKNLR